MCPTPIRPQNYLNGFSITISSNTQFFLEARTCTTGTAAEKDIYFRLAYLSIDGKESFPNRETGLSMYEEYGLCPVNCEFSLQYPLQTTEKINTGTHIACDYAMDSCSIVKWNCPNLDQKEYGEKFLEILKETFSRNESLVDI